MAHAAMVNVASDQCASKRLGSPGDADASYLMNKLTGMGMCSGNRMPKADASLSATELQTVRAWIETGASP